MKESSKSRLAELHQVLKEEKENQDELCWKSDLWDQAGQQQFQEIP